MKLIIINGPNLNLLGTREPEIYGGRSFEDFFSTLQFEFKNTELAYFQSNSEGALLDKLHESDREFDGIILNGAAYSHTSIALSDAIKAIQTPVREVHISNTYARETFRHHSYLSPVASGIIIGFGLNGYRLAIQSFLYSN